VLLFAKVISSITRHAMADFLFAELFVQDLDTQTIYSQERVVGDKMEPAGFDPPRYRHVEDRPTVDIGCPSIAGSFQPVVVESVPLIDGVSVEPLERMARSRVTGPPIFPSTEIKAVRSKNTMKPVSVGSPPPFDHHPFHRHRAGQLERRVVGGVELGYTARDLAFCCGAMPVAETGIGRELVFEYDSRGGRR